MCLLHAVGRLWRLKWAAPHASYPRTKTASSSRLPAARSEPARSSCRRQIPAGSTKSWSASWAEPWRCLPRDLLHGVARKPHALLARHLSSAEYRNKVAELVREIEEEGERKRDGNPVAGVEKILGQNPYEPPTRKTKRSSKPLFHVASKEARDELRHGLVAFLTQYCEASEALRSGNLKAANRFPEGCYPPALSFAGLPAPPRPPSPPTRQITILESGTVDRGEIPLVEIPITVRTARSEAQAASRTVAPRARGQPP